MVDDSGGPASVLHASLSVDPSRARDPFPPTSPPQPKVVAIVKLAAAISAQRPHRPSRERGQELVFMVGMAHLVGQ